MKKTLLTLATALAFAPLAFAADAPANAVPAFGQDKPLPVPHIAKKTLPNGLQVWVLPRNGLPRVDYVLAVRGAGYIADDAAHPGFARMLAGLLNEGTAKRDSRAIAEAAQGMGGAIGGTVGSGPTTSMDGILVTANALASNAAPMMQLLAEVARTPAFADKEVALAKANALQELKANEATPRYRADRALAATVYGEHAYGHTTPTSESIEAISSATLKAEHAKRFRPDQALLVITGRITEAEAMKLAAAAFGDWKATGAAPATAKAPDAAGFKPARVLLERAGSVQSTLRIGAPGMAASGADLVPLRLASTILGGGFSSRVNLNLRENKGYTYGASAGARTYFTGGHMVGGADVRNAVTGESVKEFFAEYKKLGSDLVPDAEMQMNKRYVAGSYLLVNQLQASVGNTLAQNWLNGLPAEFLGQYVPMVQKVTAEQVREMGKKYFAPEKQAIVVVGDKAVLDQLKDFGEFSVQQK